MTSRREALRTIAIAAGLGISLVPLPAALRAQDFTVVKQGRFEGRSNHLASGSAAITERDGRYYVSLGGDFAFDGAPDPQVALGSDGYRSETLLGALTSYEGAQSYPIPPGIDPAAYNEIWLWCVAADVPLGMVALR
jgi:hypothetical protein